MSRSSEEFCVWVYYRYFWNYGKYAVIVFNNNVVAKVDSGSGPQGDFEISFTISQQD